MKNSQLKKGTWKLEEDKKLLAYIEKHGHGNWSSLPAKAGLQRCGKSCRLRWTNYLRPDIKRGKFSLKEERTIIQLHALLGNRWSAIANYLEKRTDNEIKNYWNTHLKKKLTKLGIDPMTHKPKITTISSGSHRAGEAAAVANLCHVAQWENARLEAESRLVKESKLVSHHHHQISTPVVAKTLAPPSLPPCLDILKAWQSSRDGNSFLESSTSTLNFRKSLLSSVPETAMGTTLSDESWWVYDSVPITENQDFGTEEFTAEDFEENTNDWSVIMNLVNDITPLD